MKGNTMNFYELEHLASEISKTENWCPHKKVMYGHHVLSTLHLPKAEHKSSRLRFMPIVSKVVEELVQMEHLMIKHSLLVTKTMTDRKKLPKKACVKNKTQSGIFYVLHENCWLERLNTPEKNIVLVVTGNLVGEFSFFSQEKNKLYLHRFKFEQKGIFDFDFLQNSSLYIPNLALKH